jgi:hypothetical protein
MTKPVNRRALVKGAATVIPAAVAFGMLNSKWAFAQTGDFESPVDVLNFALTLEHLEAEFYRQGNEQVALEGKEQEYLQIIQEDEEEHVRILTSTIMDVGGTPVPAPGVDFGEAVQNREGFLELAFVLENTGVSAYLGAAPSLFAQGELELLSAAASIFGIEARHAAIIGNLQGKPAEGGVYMTAFESPLPSGEVIAAITPFLTDAAAMASDAAVTH